MAGRIHAPAKTACLVHGEPRPMDALKARIERELADGQDAKLGEKINLASMTRPFGTD
jgi:hypothetical protein